MAHVMTRRTKFVLDEDHIPRAWYNIAADLPVPPSPYLHPATLEPIHGHDGAFHVLTGRAAGEEIAFDAAASTFELGGFVYRRAR